MDVNVKRTKKYFLRIAICFSSLFYFSCKDKEVNYYANSSGPDLSFKIAGLDTALCYLSFQSAPYKLKDVNKERIELSGQFNIIWASEEDAEDFTLNLNINDKPIPINGIYSLTVSTLINNKESFFYYNDSLKKIPGFLADLKQNNNCTDSVFHLSATHPFTLTEVNAMKPLITNMSVALGKQKVFAKTNYILEEREYHNPADFPGVR